MEKKKNNKQTYWGKVNKQKSRAKKGENRTTTVYIQNLVSALTTIKQFPLGTWEHSQTSEKHKY